MKPKRITDGTCYNGTHWLDEKDCNSCKLLQECLKLNNPTTKVPVPVITQIPEVKQQVQKQPLTKIIEDTLVLGGLYDEVINSISEKSMEEKSKIQKWIISICKKIRNNDPRWGKYQNISVEGYLQIKLR